jgi:uncharacterized membrane protein
LKEDKFDRIEKELEELHKELSRISGRLSLQREGFKFSDLVQEVAGAVLLAFPFAVNSDIWELSEKISVAHATFILLFLIVSLFFVIEYSNLGNWKKEHLVGFLPLRLVTITVVSLLVSALSLLVLGVYPAIIDSASWFFKATVLVCLFSVVGSFGLDAAK